ALGSRCGRPWPYPLAVREVNHRIENDLVSRLDAVPHFNLRSKVTRDRYFSDVDDPVFHDTDLQAVAIEDDGISRNQQRVGLARNMELDGTVNSRRQGAVGIGNIDLGQQGPR